MLMILAKMFKIRQALMKKGFSISSSFAFFRNKFDDSVSVARGSCNTLTGNTEPFKETRLCVAL